MTSISAPAACEAAPRPLAAGRDAPAALFAAARDLLAHIETGRRIDAAVLRTAMESAFGASDTDGAWDWKTGYDACEAATVLFLRKYGKALLRKAGTPAGLLGGLEKIAGLIDILLTNSFEAVKAAKKLIFDIDGKPVKKKLMKTILKNYLKR